MCGLWDLDDLFDQTVCVASRPNTKRGVCSITQVVFTPLLVLSLSLIDVVTVFAQDLVASEA